MNNMHENHHVGSDTSHSSSNIKDLMSMFNNKHQNLNIIVKGSQQDQNQDQEQQQDQNQDQEQQQNLNQQHEQPCQSQLVAFYYAPTSNMHMCMPTASCHVCEQARRDEQYRSASLVHLSWENAFEAAKRKTDSDSDTCKLEDLLIDNKEEKKTE